MFLELAEFLRCPEDHPQAHCVIVPLQMTGRDVIEGTVGCPACQREYAIRNGVVRFGQPPEGTLTDSYRRLPALTDPLPAASDVAALLGVTTPGGHMVLVGSAARLAREIAEIVDGVHLVGVNPPLGAVPGEGLSLLEATASLPLRDAMGRGVVLGCEYCNEPWLREAVRVLLPGLRLVTLGDVAASGLEQVITGEGMSVGRKAR